MLLDGLILGIPTLVLSLLLVHFYGHPHRALLNGRLDTNRELSTPARILDYVISAAIGGIYFTILNGTGSGQTVGNRAASIAIRDAASGRTIGLGRSLLRWFVRTVLYVAIVIPGLVNDLFPVWDRRHQTIADKAARSVVIRLR